MPDRSHRVSPASIRLRRVETTDLPELFQHQLDPEANRMAGTRPRSAESFRAVWDRSFEDPATVTRVILRDGRLVGGISCFKMDGLDSVGYWIAREHWGRGIATCALKLLLREVTVRPLHASAARSNHASVRVLENCGFRLSGYHTGEETERYLPCEVATFILD